MDRVGSITRLSNLVGDQYAAVGESESTSCSHCSRFLSSSLLLKLTRTSEADENVDLQPRVWTLDASSLMKLFS